MPDNRSLLPLSGFCFQPHPLSGNENYVLHRSTFKKFYLFILILWYWSSGGHCLGCCEFVVNRDDSVAAVWASPVFGFSSCEFKLRVHEAVGLTQSGLWCLAAICGMHMWIFPVRMKACVHCISWAILEHWPPGSPRLLLEWIQRVLILFTIIKKPDHWLSEPQPTYFPIHSSWFLDTLLSVFHKHISIFLHPDLPPPVHVAQPACFFGCSNLFSLKSFLNLLSIEYQSLLFDSFNF